MLFRSPGDLRVTAGVRPRLAELADRFTVDVEDESGHVANWAFEMGAPGALKNTGWTRTSMKIGDLVTVEGTQAKDGGTHANARAVTLSTTGKRLGAASSQGN